MFTKFPHSQNQRSPESVGGKDRPEPGKKQVGRLQSAVLSHNETARGEKAAGEKIYSLLLLSVRKINLLLWGSVSALCTPLCTH